MEVLFVMLAAAVYYGWLFYCASNYTKWGK
jgi:hypothetical protein